MSSVSRTSRALSCLCLALAPVLLLAFPAHAADVAVTLGAGNGFSVKNNTGAIERLRVDEATGNISRNGALFVHTTGTNNTFVGAGAGNLTTSGYGENSAFGRLALAANTTGYRNTAAGSYALFANTTGFFNTAAGFSALRYNTTGNRNTAAGYAALFSNTTGASNTAAGYNALFSNTTGQFNTAAGSVALFSNTTGFHNTAAGYAALFYNTTGFHNTAAGYDALFSNTTGFHNTAAGSYALFSNTTGYSNSALGESVLRQNTTGPQNSALGKDALRDNTTGGANSAFGSTALRRNTTSSRNSAFGQATLAKNTTGDDNTAFGRAALYYNTTGSRNIAVGSSAGYGQTTGSDNIYLANVGAAGETGQIKIGTVGTHTQAHVAGIHGATSSSGIAVLVNASGTLGTTTSSARFKQNVRDMANASDVLLKLRPVTFHYREETVGAEEAKATQYGLIAEEVAAVAPELVAPDAEGKPYSVKYHELPALLLNELQQQQRTIDGQQQTIEALLTRVAELEHRSAARVE